MASDEQIEQLRVAFNQYAIDADWLAITQAEVSQDKPKREAADIVACGDILFENEVPLAGIKVGETDPSDGLLWCTDCRVIFALIERSWLKKHRVHIVQFPFDSIMRVEHRKFMLAVFGGSKIVFHIATTSAQGRVVENEYLVRGPKAADFVQAVKDAQRAYLNRSQTPIRTVAPQPAKSADLTAELERLTKLRNAGALTAEEFAAAKQKLLGL